jgi:hypothetical protein
MDFKVDIVYLWCDGSDPAFKNRKQIFIDKMNKTNVFRPYDESSSTHHIEQLNEIKYSLRSVEKYLP